MEKLSRIERFIAAFYCIWFFIHLGFFFYAEENADSSVFWPFIKKGQTLYTTYDVFEFLIYIGTPLLLYIVYKILFSWQDEEEKYRNHQRRSSHSYFSAFLDEKIKVEELTQKINELRNQPVNYDYLDELKRDKEKINTHHINGWLDKLEVKKKYKDFEHK
jgi:hypothetical protein